ncbi:hypothetical protein NLJ89_g5756 [Agrocybe chaxingu]|uniref:Uncharacterized protein n=1 Tax=Agrocybe chaxingu TaxID=84603 RepID=A0A9W8K0N3_9AGAR|nr:hypothetical protein NLJ89_g5756 [Agrocybe chaxingu]
MVLVARRVRQWLEPELYRIIRSGDDGKVIPPLYKSNYRHTVAGCTPDLERIAKFGPHVRHTLLQNRPSEEIGKILQLCPNVQNLAIWIIHGSCSHLVPILEGLRSLRRLSFDPSYFFQDYCDDWKVPLDLPAFSRLTHLEIINASQHWGKWKKLASMPALTHLALAGLVDGALVDHILKECQRLELLITFYLDIPFTGLQDASNKDPRAVQLLSVTNHLEHWEHGARGGEDFWITAEKVKRKRIEEQGSACSP